MIAGPRRTPRRARRAALGLLLAAFPMACAGAGLAVASVGVSLIFTGASPGAILLEKGSQLSGQKLPFEDPIVLDDVTPIVERCAILGGDLTRKILVRLAVRSEPAGASDLEVRIDLVRATGEIENLDEFTLTSLPSTTTLFVTKVELAGKKGPQTFAGDCIRFGFENTDPAAGTVTIEPEESELKIRVRRKPGIDLLVFGDGFRPLLRETFAGATVTNFVIDNGSTSSAGFAALTTAAPFILEGTATGATEPPLEVEMTIPEKGKMEHRIFARCTTANQSSTFELRVIVTDPGTGNDTTIGEAGPFTVGDQEELFEGKFGARQEAVVVVDGQLAGSGPPTTPIRLDIENTGAEPIEIIADTGNLEETSTIHLPGFQVIGTFSHGDALMTQPKSKP